MDFLIFNLQSSFSKARSVSLVAKHPDKGASLLLPPPAPLQLPACFSLTLNIAGVSGVASEEVRGQETAEGGQWLGVKSLVEKLYILSKLTACVWNPSVFKACIGFNVLWTGDRNKLYWPELNRVATLVTHLPRANSNIMLNPLKVFALWIHRFFIA